MDAFNWGAVAVALIAAIGAWLAQRSAAKSAKYNADAAIASTKATSELEAYNRARSMDVQTIQRQDEEIEELRTENQEIKNRFKLLEREHESLILQNREQQREIETLKTQVTRLQKWKGSNYG